MKTLPTLRRRLFGISSAEAEFARRGFEPTTGAKQRVLETAGATFIEGYNRAIAHGRGTGVADLLFDVDPSRLGFAFEGAAMALALLDRLLPWRGTRLQTLLAGDGDPHRYMVFVGAGWALARLRRSPRSLLGLDPILGWLAVDGMGFHDAYFHPDRTIGRAERSARAMGVAAHVFDQGVGRAMWFVCGANVTRTSSTVSGFSAERHADLWSGVGLAATYAGAVDRDELLALREASGEHASHLGQGSAFAAKARMRAANPTPHVDAATDVLCGLSCGAAADLTDEALSATLAIVDRSDREDGEPAYERWRAGVRSRLEASARV